MSKIYNREYLKDRRQELRNNATPTEKLLWAELKNKQTGYKFRRQFSVGNYILDFYCAELKLCVEIDGPTHYGMKASEYDAVRQKFLESLGITVVRFTNHEVYESPYRVVERIRGWFPLLSGNMPPTIEEIREKLKAERIEPKQ
ncbi:MAG: endonuclease domain-containing protein [Ignavibacteriaceae bacterium]|jgi:very-short-patch-repair endonuclease|nr:endonuclease domain-containing protein [Ignavibacteriaceae bacterium]